MHETSPKPTRGMQRGAALITALLLLLVMTILSITVMQMSRVQEHMVGNTRDSNVAFETAEAAVRSGEAIINGYAAPVFCATCNIREGGTIDDISDKPQDWWDTNALSFTDAKGNTMPGVARNPQIVIEHIALVRTDGDVVLGVPARGRDFFRVTARSGGASGKANAVVQTTFAHKF